MVGTYSKNIRRAVMNHKYILDEFCAVDNLLSRFTCEKESGEWLDYEPAQKECSSTPDGARRAPRLALRPT